MCSTHGCSIMQQSTVWNISAVQQQYPKIELSSLPAVPPRPSTRSQISIVLEL